MDVYHNPDQFGLTIVGEIEWSSGCYRYDKTVVWRDGAGVFYVGYSSGCSCSTPFRRWGLRDLTESTPTLIIADIVARNMQTSPERGRRRDDAIARLLERMVEP